MDSVEAGLSISNLTMNTPTLTIDNGCSNGELSQDGSCVDACTTSSYYESGNMCLSCSKACNGCTGSTKYSCQSCSDNYTIMVDSAGD